MKDKHAAFGNAPLSIGEAASLIGISADTLRRWEKSGRITSYRTPTGHRRFLRDEILALLDRASA